MRWLSAIWVANFPQAYCGRGVCQAPPDLHNFALSQGQLHSKAVAGWLLTCPNTLATPYQWTIQGLTCEPPFTYGFGQSETIGDGLELKVEF